MLTLGPTVTNVLTFSPNGRLLASGGVGKPGHLRVGHGPGIDIWDTLTGRKVTALPVSHRCVAFNPQGTRLATAGLDQAILLWESPRVQLPNDANAPSPQERDAWWTALAATAKNAYKAIGQMVDAPDHAVALLKARLAPARAQDAATVRKLIALLDSPKFAERDEARAALEKMGESAAGTMKAALSGKITVETRRRLEWLLDKCAATSSVSVRHARAVATLEWIGTTGARAFLRELAGGGAEMRLTIEAQAALTRLAE